MGRKPRNLIGKKIGKLLVLGISNKRGNKNEIYWECKCDCGNTKPIRANSLITQSSLSCGCVKYKKHGLYNTTEYYIWQHLRNRCNNPKDARYNRYGGRGIKVCPSWNSSFESFYADMGPRPSRKHSIERIDNDGDYEPSNCRWDTIKNQSRNRSNNFKITYNGETKCLVDWSELLNLNYFLLHDRLKSGWSPEKAFTTPLKHSHIT